MLLPREHGAYGQLLFPLVSALAIGRPAAGAFLLAAAASSAFLAHESALVLLGQRGARAAREQRADARRSLTLFGGIGVLSAAGAAATLPVEVLAWALVPGLLAAAVAVLVVLKRERTTSGEALVALTLTSVSAPVARAGGAAPISAATLVAVYAAVFISATIAVRAFIGRTARAGGPRPVVAGAVALTAVFVLLGLALRGTLATVAAYGALPVCLVALGLTVYPPSPKRLRAIGWTLVGATGLTAVLLIAGLR